MKYKTIEKLLYHKLYSIELVEFIFTFILSIKKKSIFEINNISIKRINALPHIYIENFHKKDNTIECKIMRCIFCKNIIHIKYMKIFYYTTNLLCERTYKLLTFQDLDKHLCI